MGKHTEAALLLKEAHDGLTSVYGAEHHDSQFYFEEAADNAHFVSNSHAAAELQQFQKELKLASSRPVARACVVGLDEETRPGLNGTSVLCLSFREDDSGQGGGVVYSVRRVAEDDQEEETSEHFELPPINLRVEAGTAVVITASQSDAHVSDVLLEAKLIGRKGVVEGFDEQEGMYDVRIGVERKCIAADNLRALIEECSL
jgi:hypothetical protein